MTAAQLLNTPVADLPVSSDFYTSCRRMGFTTLGEVVPLGIIRLSEREHFSYRWLLELIELLRRNGLSSLLMQ